MSTPSFLQAAHLSRLLQNKFGSPVQIDALRSYTIDNSASILVTLTSQQTDSLIGHFGLELAGEWQGKQQRQRMVLKVKPHGREIADMLAGLAHLSNEQLGQVYAAHVTTTGFFNTHSREIEVYQKLPHAIQPCIYGYLLAPETDAYQVLMEDLTGFTGLNSVMAVDQWTNLQLETALSALANWHVFAHDKRSVLSLSSWADTDKPNYWLQEAPLWRALLEKGAARFPECYADGLLEALNHGLDQVEILQPQLNSLPKTLIHNDANPRNSCFRADGSFCLYDWELSCSHVPVYDALELLCFVLEPDRYALMPYFLNHHRQALCREWPVWVSDGMWQQSLELAWYEFGWHRLGMYMMAHGVAPYPFLPRVWAAYAALGREIGIVKAV